MYFGGHMSGWVWLGAVIGMIAFWGLMIALGVLAFRALAGRNGAHGVGSDDHAGTGTGTGTGAGTRTGSASSAAGTDPRRILAERYARGEIDEEEFRRRLATLAGTGPPPQAPAPHDRR